jgi:glycosyltransferase involved in cell wall biosynthesis
MRLAIIASLLAVDTRGGAERYVEAAASSLAASHDVTVLTGSETGTIEGVPIVRLPHLPSLADTAPFAGRVLWHALDQWLPSVHLSVRRELKRLGPDLVATHELQGLSAAAYTAIAAHGAPHVHTAHDFNLLCARTSMTRNGEFCGGRCFDCRIQRLTRTNAIKLNLARLIGVSRYVCERHVRAGVVPPERASTVPLGADGTPRLRTASEGPVTLGFIGTLGRHKGILTLLAAIRRAEAADWRVLIAGSGALEPQVREAASRDRRVEYLGQVEERAKDEFFDELDLIVIPSEWEEPATFVAVEAAVRALPAVVSDRGGLPETPEARTFRAGDPDALTRAIRWFVDEPARLESASRRLLERHKEFEWSTHLGKVEALFEEAVGEP